MLVKVTRWFLKTNQNEIIDGPFRTKKQAEKERDRHDKLYHYRPKLESEEILLNKRHA